MTKRKTQELFLKEMEDIFGNRYDFTKAKYVSAKVKVEVVCPEHGVFWTTPDSLHYGIACKKCSASKAALLRKYPQEVFVSKAIAVHADKYDYTDTEYLGCRHKVSIFCKAHQRHFQQSPVKHLAGQGCPDCALAASALRMRSDTEDFIAKAINVQGSRYDYSLVLYKTAIEKVKILCTTHGVFSQTPNAHLNGQGCPCCSTGGFTPTKSAVIYVYSILGHEVPITGYGITGMLSNRERRHRKALSKNDMEIVERYISPVIMGTDAANIEQKLIREFCRHHNGFPVEGFFKEHTTSRFTSVVAFIEDEILKLAGEQYGNP